MKIINFKDKPERIVQKIEELFTDNNVHLYVDGDGEIVIDIDGKKYKIYNTTMERCEHSFPRVFNDDRLVEIE